MHAACRSNLLFFVLVGVSACGKSGDQDYAPEPATPISKTGGDALQKGEISLTIIAKEHPPTSHAEKLSYADLKPILDQNCNGCHNADTLNFTNFPFAYDKTMYTSDEDVYRKMKYRINITPGGTDADSVMPPTSETRPSKDSIQKLTDWLSQLVGEIPTPPEIMVQQSAGVKIKFDDTATQSSSSTYAKDAENKMIMAIIKILNVEKGKSISGMIEIMRADGTSIEKRVFKTPVIQTFDAVTVSAL